MCGIAGKISFDASQRLDPDEILRSTRALAHRGPDDEGVWVDGPVALGHRRLSIIDLSADGHNPMSNEDGTVWIVFNGEVYNFRDLRPELESRGHRFRSRTDTEVIIHAYEEWGPSCVERLRGMFAFAIWDRRARQLMLARDRLGVKPLYYCVSNDALSFASELKGLTASADLDAEVSPDAIHQFLVWQCIPSPASVFKQIRKLEPGTLLLASLSGKIEIRRYWQLTYQPVKSDPADLAEQVHNHVVEATRARLVSDVPIGVFLSGGIDSACVVASMREAGADPIRTFSIAFDDPQVDESRYARLVADHFSTTHTEFKVTPEAIDLLPQMAAMFDEPFADVAAIPTYLLAKLTRKHVKVALSGDGGDESFGGYERYLALKLLSRVSRAPLNRLVATAGRLKLRNQAWSKFQRLAPLAGRPPKEQYGALMCGMFEEERWLALYSYDFRQSLTSEDTTSDFLKGWDTPGANDILSRAMASDIATYIPECLNVKTDIATMAVGLELRSPFLDHHLVEFAATIPSDAKIRGREQKYILKQAFKRQLPRAILNRGKAGFTMPLARWLRKDLAGLTADMLLSRSSYVRDYLKPTALERLFNDHVAEKANNHTQLWRLLVLESWHRRQKENVDTRVPQHSSRPA